MRLPTLCVAAVALSAQPVSAQMASVPAIAQPLGSTITGRGAEVRVGVRWAIGSRAQLAREARPLEMELRAGPALRLQGAGPIDRPVMVQGNAMRLSFAPGHSTQLALGGVPLMTRYASPRIAADAEGNGQGRGVSPLAIAGGALLIGLGVAYLALEDAIDCNEGGSYVCE
jgi:hypothetical protein